MLDGIHQIFGSTGTAFSRLPHTIAFLPQHNLRSANSFIVEPTPWYFLRNRYSTYARTCGYPDLSDVKGQPHASGRSRSLQPPGIPF